MSPTVSLRLDEPPIVHQLGAGVHGVRRDYERYQLPTLWQLHYYRYSARARVRGVDFAILPGTVSVWPAGEDIEFWYEGRSEHYYALFEPRDVGVERTMPMVARLGTGSTLVGDLMFHAVCSPLSDRAQVTADVWASLCFLVDRAAEWRSASTAVIAAMSYIESSLGSEQRVPDIARRVGISHNQLTRLFRRSTGRTVVGYIRGRRLARARHLLVTTSLPVSTIGASVGIYDPQTFARACHAEFGCSPTAIRNGAHVVELPVWAGDASVHPITGRARHFRPGDEQELFLDRINDRGDIES